MIESMLFIGLTGGIASGKSTIARRMKELGALTLDADELARLVVQPGWPALDKIAEAFGQDVLHSDGSLDRQALGSVVFHDPEKLQTLNDIVHPAIGIHVADVIQQMRDEQPDGILVYDIPLLVEHPNPYEWDLVIVAEAPEEQRIERMVSLRAMTVEEASARINNQATDAARREVADVVIDTSGSLDYTIEQTDELWARLKRGDDLRRSASD